MKNSGVSGSRRRLVAMFDYYDRHGLLAGSAALRWLLGRSPGTVQAVLTRALTGEPGPDPDREPVG